MEQIKIEEKAIIFIDQEGKIESDTFQIGYRHVERFLDYGKKVGCNFSNVGDDVYMSLQLAKQGIITINNGKVVYIVTLPESLSTEQIICMEQLKNNFSLEYEKGKILNTIVDTNQKLEYPGIYRNLEIENKINRENLNSFEQLYQEIEKQKKRVK